MLLSKMPYSQKFRIITKKKFISPFAKIMCATGKFALGLLRFLVYSILSWQRWIYVSGFKLCSGILLAGAVFLIYAAYHHNCSIIPGLMIMGMSFVSHMIAWCYDVVLSALAPKKILRHLDRYHY